MSRLLPAATLALVATLVAAPAAATRSGTLFAGPTAAEPSAMYWNPAAATLLSGTQVAASTSLTWSRLHYDRDTVDPYSGHPFDRSTYNLATPTPWLAGVSDLGLERWRVGVILSAPMIKGARWTDYVNGRPSSTRYHLLEGISGSLLLGVGAAFRIARTLSVGLALDVYGVWLRQKAMMDIGARINQIACQFGQPCEINSPLVREDPRFAASSELEGVGWSAGVSGGVLFQPTEWLSLGAMVHSGNRVSVPIHFDVSIPASVRDYLAQNLPSVTIAPISGEADVDTVWPMTAAGGATVSLLAQRLRLGFFVHWANSSETTTMLAEVRAAGNALVPGRQELVRVARDELIYHLRAAYRLSPRLVLATMLEITPATRPSEYVTVSTLSLDSVFLHVGAEWQPLEWLRLTAEYGHAFVVTDDITSSRFAPNARPTTPVEEGLDRPSPTGTYGGALDRFALAITLMF
jgi:long-subunit fatty acid transport protein